MNLKEAFHYQNYLDILANEAKLYLSSFENCTLLTQTHHKSKANPEAQDEVRTTEQIRENWNTHKDVDRVVDFYMDIIKEKHTLAILIARVKAEASFMMDAELSINKMRQEAFLALNALARRSRATHRTTKGSGYKFNAEGNQITYYYDVEEVIEPAFDPKAVKANSRKLQDEADAISTQADAFLINSDVKFEPHYRPGDTFEDAFDIFIS